MSTFLPTTPALLLSIPNPNRPTLRFVSKPQPHHQAFTTTSNSQALIFIRTSRLRSTPPSNDADEPGTETKIVDEWGEKAEPESELTRFNETDPEKEDDEWGSDESSNGTMKDDVVVVKEDVKEGEKRGLGI